MQIKNSRSLNPPERILLGPGPSSVSNRALNALAKPTIGHMDSYFLKAMNETMQMLRYVYQTDNKLTLPMSGTGSAGMETVFVNLIEQGDKVIVCVNGLFGERMVDVANRYGAEVVTVSAPWGEPINPQDVSRALQDNPDSKLVAIVHAETSTGVNQPLKEISEMTHENDALLIADMVTSLGGIPVKVDELDVDIAYSGTQKCLSCPPGLSPVTANTRAEDVLNNRDDDISSWYLDLSMLSQYWGEDRFYHHTAPVNMVYGLHESLLQIVEQGLEECFTKHRVLGGALQKGLESMGFNCLVEKEFRLPQLTTVKVPDEINESKVRERLMQQYSIEIAGGLGDLEGKVWRIGLMGSSCTWRNVVSFLGALKEILIDLDTELPYEDGLEAAADYYKSTAQNDQL